MFVYYGNMNTINSMILYHDCSAKEIAGIATNIGIPAKNVPFQNKLTNIAPLRYNRK
jgi:hypothetical protein